METTQFAAWYFRSASTGYDGWVTVRNNTSAPLVVALAVFNSTGTSLGGFSQTISGNGNFVFAIGDSLGFASGQGSALLMHTGMPGAVAGSITTVSATTGLSYDSPFVPWMSLAPFGP